MKLSLPSARQLAAFGRHIVSYAAGAVTVGVGLHFISPDQGSQIGNAVNGIVNGVASIIGGVTTLVGIASGLFAAWSASRTSQAAAIGADKSTIVNATSTGAAVVTITDPAMASAALAAQKKAA